MSYGKCELSPWWAQPKKRFAAGLLSILTLVVATVASASTPLPQADKPASADDPLLGRYAGSLIVAYERRSLGDQVLPLGKLEAAPKDAPQGRLRAAVAKTVEGQRTYFLYYAGKEASPLEIVRSYQAEIKSQGGQVLFECKEAACGGSPDANIFSNAAGLLNFMYPSDEATPKYYNTKGPKGEVTPVHCSMFLGIQRLQYTTIKLPGTNGYAAIAAYTVRGDGPADCNNFAGGTFASVFLVDTVPRKSRMVGVNAAQITNALQSSGRIAIYGIYFDFDKAEVKPESDPTLQQIAKALQDKPALKLLVVGHTDHVGTFEANMGLSQRRAAAVVSALTGRYGVKPDRLTAVGVSYAAPVASNQTEEGRSQNRRVELVEN